MGKIKETVTAAETLTEKVNEAGLNFDVNDFKNHMDIDLISSRNSLSG